MKKHRGREFSIEYVLSPSGGLFQGFSFIPGKADTERRRLLFPIVCHDANSLVEFAAFDENTCKMVSIQLNAPVGSRGYRVLA